MCKDDILKRVIELFSTMTEAEDITEDSALIDDLEISSMDVLLLVSGIEEEFGIQVPEKAIRQMVTIGDVAEIVGSLLK